MLAVTGIPWVYADVALWAPETVRVQGLRAAPLRCTGSECVVNPTVGKTEVPSTGRITGTGISVTKMEGVAVTRVGGVALAMVGGVGITEDGGVLITGEVVSASLKAGASALSE